MSPIGGVGINLAIQDAVAAANILAAPLKEGRVTDALLEAVQRRRTLPTRVIQWLQVQDAEQRAQPGAQEHRAAEAAIRGQAA